MKGKEDIGADRRAEILKQYKDHKMTSTQAREALKKLEADIRRCKKKKGGKRK